MDIKNLRHKQFLASPPKGWDDGMDEETKDFVLFMSFKAIGAGVNFWHLWGGVTTFRRVDTHHAEGIMVFDQGDDARYFSTGSLIVVRDGPHGKLALYEIRSSKRPGQAAVKIFPANATAMQAPVSDGGSAVGAWWLGTVALSCFGAGAES